MAQVSTCEFIGPTLIVYPSGAARATLPTPIVPAAPLTFSTITGCPSETCILAAMIRASVSVGPPAANGNTIVMGCEGYVSEIAGPIGVRLQQAAAMADRKIRLLIMFPRQHTVSPRG